MNQILKKYHLAIIAGVEFWQLRHYKETIVASEDLTEIKWFSDYVPSLKNTWMDTPVFIFDSGVEGGTVFICGCPHPYEPASTMAAYLMIENLHVEKGKVIIVPRANYSGSTDGMLGDAYPKFFHVSSDCAVVGFSCAPSLRVLPISRVTFLPPVMLMPVGL